MGRAIGAVVDAFVGNEHGRGRGPHRSECMNDSSQPVIAVRGLSYRFGKKSVLDALDLDVPQGAFYALLGANGAGKTTLLQLIAGARPMQQGSANVFGFSVSQLTIGQRQQMTYVAEGQELPTWMRLEQLEAFCAPLYDTWDMSLATKLRARFDLDPKARIDAMSRGQRMKAALLCTLAPRPKLIVMDEPFTGMDVAVKDDLVRGLLDAASLEGATVLLCSHDIAEIEPLADWVGFLNNGRVSISAPLDELRERYKRLEFTTETSTRMPEQLPNNWMSIERAGLRVSVLVKDFSDDRALPAPFQDATRVNVRDATLKELYIAIAKPTRDIVEVPV